MCGQVSRISGALIQKSVFDQILARKAGVATGAPQMDSLGSACLELGWGWSGRGGADLRSALLVASRTEKGQAGTLWGLSKLKHDSKVDVEGILGDFVK